MTAGINRNISLLHSRRRIFEFARLQIARKIREEGRRNLHPDVMVPPKNIACDQVVEMQLVHPVRRKRLPSLLEIAIAGTHHVESRAHHIESRAVGSYVE